MSEPASQTSLEGKHDKYLISKTYLGGGTFGAVYKGKRVRDDKEMAIKIITGSEKVPLNVRNVQNEVAILKELAINCHPFIVCFYDFIEDPADKIYYIVMEYVKGVNLIQVRKEMDDDTIEELLPRIILETALGLQQIHDAGILHRDIKPDNIILTTSNHIKIVDLGLGCTFFPSTTIKPCAKYAGSARYLDPLASIDENKNTYELTTKSDIFSLGQTLFWLITGEAPPVFFKKTREQLTEVHNRAKLNVRLDADTIDNLVMDMINPTEPDMRPTLEHIINEIQDRYGDS